MQTLRAGASRLGPRLAASSSTSTRTQLASAPRRCLPGLQPLAAPGRRAAAAPQPRLVALRAGGGGGSGEEEEEAAVQYSTQFGYSRKDVLLIGGGLIAFGYVMYYGLQAAGLDAGAAGNWVQLIIFIGICIGWVGSYLWRVATKQMTYARQLQDYEEAVMRKRLEEIPEAEMERLAAEIEEEKAAARRARGL